MTIPINMPQVGQDIETAVIAEWKVKEGDSVKIGDVIALVESDKAVFEVEVFQNGVIIRLLYRAGDEARVLQPIALLETSDVESVASEVVSEAPKPDRATKPFASPSARRLAREHDVDLRTLVGSGPRGRIIKEDILRAAAKKSTSRTKEPIATEPLAITGDRVILFDKMRQTIADRLTAAQAIPQFQLYMDADMTAALAWREAYNQTAAPISITDLIIKAAAHALRQYPQMNAHVAADRLVIKEKINIGVAVSVADGLLVPVIASVDQLTLTQISAELKEAVRQARAGVVKAAEGTFTVSNLGMYGVNRFAPILNPPQAAILGVGAVEPRAVPISGGFVVRQMLSLSLVCDHRAVDGAYAAEFFKAIRDFLQKLNL